MIGNLNHVGVATPSIADSIKLYRDILGATRIGEPFDLPAQGGEGLLHRHPDGPDRTDRAL